MDAIEYWVGPVNSELDGKRALKGCCFIRFVDGAESRRKGSEFYVGRDSAGGREIMERYRSIKPYRDKSTEIIPMLNDMRFVVKGARGKVVWNCFFVEKTQHSRWCDFLESVYPLLEEIKE